MQAIQHDKSNIFASVSSHNIGSQITSELIVWNMHCWVSTFCEGCITCQNVILLGDVVKYFLYVYQPDSSRDLNVLQESDLGNSSIECEAEQTKDGGWLMHLMLAIHVHCILFGHCRTLSCI